MIYIYGLRCPLAGTVRYVGKSFDPHGRLGRHIQGAKHRAYDHHTARWLRKLLDKGLKPEVVILHTCADGERWQEIERSFIASAKERGWRLTNSTAGGEGLDYIDPEAGARYRRNLSAAMKKVWNTPEGKATASRRALIANANPETQARRSASLKKAYENSEFRALNTKINRDINARPEVRAKRSATIKETWADPEIGAKRRAALNSQEARTKMSESAKRRAADPKKTEKLFAIRATPEHRAKLSERAKLRATPEYRAMMAEKTRLSWEARRAKSTA